MTQHLSQSRSTMNSKPAVRAFATLGFHGDRLDPGRISAILDVPPTKAWRKGERYFAGPRAGLLVGRTGTWLLATDAYVEGKDLQRHLDFLTRLVSRRAQDGKERLTELQEMMAKDGVRADVSLFWHGQPGEPRPFIPEQALQTLRALPAKIEDDFDTD
jgi:hypothetical protein